MTARRAAANDNHRRRKKRREGGCRNSVFLLVHPSSTVSCLCSWASAVGWGGGAGAEKRRGEKQKRRVNDRRRWERQADHVVWSRLHVRDISVEATAVIVKSHHLRKERRHEVIEKKEIYFFSDQLMKC